MLRFLARAIGALAIALPLSASASQFTVPDGVNLHNGYIEVINAVKYHDGFQSDAYVSFNYILFNHVIQGRVGSGRTFILNKCCVLAGTTYKVEVDYQGASSSLSVPRIDAECPVER